MITFFRNICLFLGGPRSPPRSNSVSVMVNNLIILLIIIFIITYVYNITFIIGHVNVLLYLIIIK